MVITLRDQQDDGRLDAGARVSDQRTVAAAKMPSNADPGAARRPNLPSRSGRRPAWVGTRARARAAVAVAALIMIVILALLASAGEANLVRLLAVCLAAAGSLAVIGFSLRGAGRPRRRSRRSTRIAVIGSQSAAVALTQELVINRISAYEMVGWIASRTGQGPEFPLPQALGAMGDLAELIERNRIDLVLIGSDVPRLEVFDELVRLTDILCVRVCELTAFYEDAFGHIPVAEINSAWFQYVMHPKFRPTKHPVKRVFDIALSACLGIGTLPVLLPAAMLIKLDGGRVLYRQCRIGEKGRPFTMYKLRTMRERPDNDADRWCAVDDPRVTRVGRVLRSLHLDELPQLYNVLRSEMSIVGPRPEQPEIVSRLEAGITFYSRRHLIKPGLAGWAQLRCGYARSERGSAWKLCHDLYYLKHQSLRFDMVILMRTFLTLALQVPTHGVTGDVVKEAHADAHSPETLDDRAVTVT